VVEKTAAPDTGRSGVERMIGDFYASCMDEPGIEARGLEPLRPDLQRIAAIKSKKTLVAEMARLHSQGVNLPLAREYAGTSLLFRSGSEQDAKDATSVIAVVDQGGLGLPDRDYYFRDDAKSGETRDRYRDHLAGVFELLGDSKQRAALAAKRVMAIETALARVSLERVKRR